ncbi:MAG: hypothetical protein ABI655_08110 [Phenylobacterium sp.]
MGGPLTSYVAQMVKKRVDTWAAGAGMDDVYGLLRYLARWRSQVLARTYIQRQGVKVHGGPFAGMEYLEAPSEGPLISRLLGVYESELHPHIAAAVAKGLDCVIDVGCAEGYYAVGLARMIPEITVYAYDIEERARTGCAALAAKNGVSDRVIIGAEFKPDGFEVFAGRRALVIVDTEGAEVDILQPALSPVLAGMTIIVETHDVFHPGAMAMMIERFSPTHEIVRVDQQPKLLELPPWLQELPHLDHLLAVWEWRAAPTPWLVMTPRAGH